MAGTSMQQRRDPAATWAANNPVLKAGEIGYTSDTKIIKFGDGATPWNSLPGVAYMDTANVKELPVGGSIPLRTADGTLRAVGGDEDNEVVILSQISGFGRYRGTGNALPTAGTSRAGDMYYHTVLRCLMMFDTIGWRQVERGRGTATERIAIPSAQLYWGFEFEDSAAPKIAWRWNGAEWEALTKISGKMWRTAGFSPALAADAVHKVDYDASRVAGGMSANVAGTAADMTIPADGQYRITATSTVLGGSGYTTSLIVYRVRTSVANSTAISGDGQKLNANDLQFSIHGVAPLKAGDTFYSAAIMRGTAAGTYYGINETQSSLHMEYVGPLNGATPL